MRPVGSRFYRVTFNRGRGIVYREREFSSFAAGIPQEGYAVIDRDRVIIIIIEHRVNTFIESYLEQHLMSQ